MKIFITGTDTDVGKTIVSAWICAHTGYDYWKPIQTGSSQGTDSDFIKKITNVNVHSEAYLYESPCSPHIAAKLANEIIDFNKISMPDVTNLIIEGAGGLLVPINNEFLMIDLIKKLNVPVLLVTKAVLGAINHTLLSIEAMKLRNIKIKGVIINNCINNELEKSIKKSIEFYSNIPVLASLPKLKELTFNKLKLIALPEKLLAINSLIALVVTV